MYGMKADSTDGLGGIGGGTCERGIQGSVVRFSRITDRRRGGGGKRQINKEIS